MRNAVLKTAPHAAPSRAYPKSTLPFPKDPAGWPGGHRKVDTPDPIPNSAVKHLSAHGTVAQATGESVAAGPPSRILASPVTHTTAGWSSPVARQAHNLKVTGSNPVPASKIQKHQTPLPQNHSGQGRRAFMGTWVFRGIRCLNLTRKGHGGWSPSPDLLYPPACQMPFPRFPTTSPA
jgi:hypothetical protein